jgi:hypothetical protein
MGVNRAEHVAAAVEIEDGAVDRRAGRGDPFGFDAAGVDLLRLRPDRRLDVGEQVVLPLAHLLKRRLRPPGAERGDDVGDDLVELSAGHRILLYGLQVAPWM